jgi:hypothetical protein
MATGRADAWLGEDEPVARINRSPDERSDIRDSSMHGPPRIRCAHPGHKLKRFVKQRAQPMLRRPAALFRRCRAKPPFSVPRMEGVKRRNALVRSAAPRGPPRGSGRSADRRRPPAHSVSKTRVNALMDARRRAFRRFTAAFSFRHRAALSSGHCPGSSASSWRAARSGLPGGAPTPPGCLLARQSARAPHPAPPSRRLMNAPFRERDGPQ